MTAWLQWGRGSLRWSRVALALMAFGAIVTAAYHAGSAAPMAAVKIAIGDPCGEVNSLDPINQPGNECSVMVNQVYNRLLDKDSQFKVHPELAASFEHNAAATQWTFHLRKGIKFHDGHELTSKDVVWTFRRLLDPAAKSEGAAQLAFLDPNGITGPDPYTVVFNLPKPVAELPGRCRLHVEVVVVEVIRPP